MSFFKTLSDEEFADRLAGRTKRGRKNQADAIIRQMEEAFNSDAKAVGLELDMDACPVGVQSLRASIKKLELTDKLEIHTATNDDDTKITWVTVTR